MLTRSGGLSLDVGHQGGGSATRLVLQSGSPNTAQVCSAAIYVNMITGFSFKIVIGEWKTALHWLMENFPYFGCSMCLTMHYVQAIMTHGCRYKYVNS